MQLASSGIPQMGTGGGYTETLLNLNTSSSKFVALFTPPEDVTITHLGVSYDLRTGTPPVHRISLQRTVLGIPDGGVLASRIFTPPADATWDGTFRWIELLNPYSADRGEELALCLEYSSGVVSNSNKSRWLVALGGSRAGRGHFPYYITNNGSQVRVSNQPIFGYKSSVRSYGLPLKGISDEAINSPGEAGMHLLFDRGFGASFQLGGAAWIGRLAQAAGETIDLVLYDSENNEIHRASKDVDQAAVTANADKVNEFLFDDATLEGIRFGEEYYLVLAPGGPTTQSRLRTFDVQDATDMSALRGGSGLYLVTRASPTDPWTEHRDRRPIFTDLFLRGWSV